MEAQTSDTSFAVDPAELDVLLAGVRQLEQAMERHVRTFESLTLRSGVFGRLPSISSKLHDAYSRHVEEGTKALAEGRAVLDATADKAGASAQGYRHVEQQNIALISEISASLEPRPAAGAEA